VLVFQQTVKPFWRVHFRCNVTSNLL